MPTIAEKIIARRLKELRNEHNLTLSCLSERSGLSESYISRVENLKTAVSIASLSKIAEAFFVPLGTFFESDFEQERVLFTPAGKGQVMRLRGRNGIEIRRLASKFKGRSMEPFEVNVATASPQAPLQSHEGEEFLYVLTGRCVLSVGSKHYEMSEADCIYFDSGIPHRIQAEKESDCKVLSVVTSRNFSFHGNLTKLINE